MSIKSFFTNAEAKGSAFFKVAEADVKAIEAKDRIVAIDAANEAKTVLVKFFEEEVERVHAETAKIHADLDAILAKL
ncbi:MAG TPA: hypothetical protein VJ476_05925 [Rhizomicrobium sp.]|nr:hypothetical protein [Rhizomicrobium sp.]